MSLAQRLTQLENTVHKLLRDAPWKQHETGVGPQYAPAKEGDSASGKSPLLPQIPPAPTDPQKADKPWYKTLNGWKTAFEIVAIPFAIAYAVIAYDQWHDANLNFKVDERAWLKFDAMGPGPTATAGMPLRIPMRLINIGKTTALDVQAGIIIDLVPAGSRPPGLPKGKQGLAFPGMPVPKNAFFIRSMPVWKLDTGIIYPADTDTFVATRMHLTPQGTLAAETTQDEINAIANKAAYLAIWGQVWYFDIFRVQHWTRFCIAVGTPGYEPQSEDCAHFSEVDR